MLRVPTWLFVLLLPFVFLGSCKLSVRPIWRWLERGAIEYLQAEDTRDFPVLCRTEDGRFIAARMSDIPNRAAIVTKVADVDEERANRDLRESVGRSGDYRFFTILAERDDVFLVSLEYPTNRDAKLKGWYSLGNDRVVPERILRYGPGFAFAVLPWSMCSGAVGTAVFVLLVRRRKAAQPGATDNPDDAQRSREDH